MNSNRLRSLLSRFSDLTILVVGDFFLDRYLIIDPDLTEKSLETDLDARQVVEIRNSPGAAGTVTSNLKALGVGSVRALGVIGDDGHGFDLVKALRRTDVESEDLIALPNRFTPTYTKPRSAGNELERLDVKNRQPLPQEAEARLISRMETMAAEADGVIVLDQVQERNCGVVTDRMRREVERLGGRSNSVVFADSRVRIGEFGKVILKPNLREAAEAMGIGDSEERADTRRACAMGMSQRTGRPVFLTLGSDGILAADGKESWHTPGISVPEPIDIVGAGDSVSAAVVAALCAGASVPEAALVGVLVSSITIQQIGTTGTATPDQVLLRFEQVYPDGFEKRHG